MIRLPTENDRLVIIGRTGGGKTMAGLWHLSMQPLDSFSWIIVDFKLDENIARIPYLQPWDMKTLPPEGGGLYVIRPTTAQVESGELEDFLHDLWDAGNTGLYVDEGAKLRRSLAYADIQMQGRSKRIPTITCTQLPVYLPRPVFTEANYIQVFYVLDKRYRKTIEEFTPIDADQMEQLQRFWSYYYDVVENQLTLLRPGPVLDRLLPTFEKMLRPPADVNDEIPAPVQATGYTRNPI